MAEILSIVTLITGLTREGFDLWQAWCSQNPDATNDEAIAYLVQTNDDARGVYFRSQDKAKKLQMEKDLRDAQLRDTNTQP